VYVFDRTVNPAGMCYKISGVEEAARSAGARVLMVRDEDFVPVKIPNGRELKEWSIHKLVFDVDVVINVPVAKHHGLTHLTLGMKNIMGLIGGNRGRIHTNIGEKLTDLNSVIPIHLTVVDAYRILLRHGPQGGRQEDVKLAKKLIMGADRVAVDAFATTLFDMEWEKIPYIKAAHERGLGEGDFTKKEIIKVKV